MSTTSKPKPENSGLNWLNDQASVIIIFLLIILVVIALVILATLCRRLFSRRRHNNSGSTRCHCYVNDGYRYDPSHSVQNQSGFLPFNGCNQMQCSRCYYQLQNNTRCPQLYHGGVMQNVNLSSPIQNNKPVSSVDIPICHPEFVRPNNTAEQHECGDQIIQSTSSCGELPLSYSDSEILYDPEETQPMTVPNQELFSKIPPQLLVVSQRSQTITVQNKEVVFIARRVSSKGDNLVLDKMGVSLCVPPGAIKDGELKTIVLVLNWDLSDNPNMTEKQALVSPVVYVGPHDLKLEKQCTLCFKHCSFDTRQIKIMKSETELTESKEWNEYCNVEDDTGLCVLTPDECQLRIDTFTLYTCLQSPTDTEDCRKWLQVAAFSMPLKSNINHQQVRLYFLNKTPCALQWAIQNEAKFGGQMMGPEKTYLFYGNAQDMFISLRYLSEGWDNVDKEIEEHVPYINIWHGKCPHITMCYKKYCYPRELTFKLFLYQYSLENEGGNFIAHTTEDNNKYETPTGSRNVCGKHEIVMKLPSRPNDFRDSGDSKSSYRSCGDSQVHIHIRAEEQIDLEKVEFATKGYYPYALKVNLKVLLDPPSPFDKNWRALAAALGKEGCIRYLETKESPTDHLLNFAESSKLSLETLAEVLSCMQREDAAQLIKDYIPHSGSDTAQSRSAVENTCHYNITQER